VRTLSDIELRSTDRAAIVAAAAMLREYGVIISTLVIEEDQWLHGPYQVLAIRREVDRDGVAA